MKKNLSLLYKARLFLHWMTGQNGVGLMASCDFCHSTKIKRESHSTEISSRQEVKYKAIYSCQSCGAIASVREVWRKHDTT